MGFPKRQDASSLQGVGVSTVAPSNGEVLQYSSASGTWGPGARPAAVTAELGADLAVVAATGTAVLSISLGVGTWLVTGSLTAINGAATAAIIEVVVAVGTATASFAGAASASTEFPAVLSGSRSLAVAVLVTVTAAGTLVLSVESANACTVKALSPAYAFQAATGIVATPIN